MASACQNGRPCIHLAAYSTISATGVLSGLTPLQLQVACADTHILHLELPTLLWPQVRHIAFNKPLGTLNSASLALVRCLRDCFALWKCTSHSGLLPLLSHWAPKGQNNLKLT